jgi:hypothetical protein
VEIRIIKRRNIMGEYIHIEGVIENPNGLDYEELMNDFLTWLEDKGCFFGGGWYPVDENGDRFVNK